MSGMYRTHADFLLPCNTRARYCSRFAWLQQFFDRKLHYALKLRIEFK